MGKISFEKTSIEGLIKIRPFKATDNRGAFIKDYSYDEFALNGIEYSLKEVFYTVSKRGVLRGLHFQRVKQQPKLVRCLFGRIFDVVVDLRKDSKTFKSWECFRMSGKDNMEILVPAGCAHGYLVLEESIVSYKCSEKFYGEYDTGILWNDMDLDISWPLEEIGGLEDIILSEKDQALPSFQEYSKL